MAVYNLSKEPKNQHKFIKDKRKTIGISLVAISTIAFFALLTNFLTVIKVFILGLTGLFSYPLFITLFVIGVALINKRKYVMTKKYIVYLCIAILALLCILHMLFIDKSGTFFEYLGRSYNNGLTAGGLLCGLLTAPFIFVLSTAGAYIIFSAVLIIFVALIADYIYYLNHTSTKKSLVLNQIPKKIEEPVFKPKRSVEKPNVVLDGKIKNEKLEDANSRKLGVLLSNQEQKQNTEEPKKAAAPKSLKEYLLSPTEGKVDMSKYSKFKDKNLNTIQENLEKIKNEPNLPSEEPKHTMPSKIIHDDQGYSPNFSLDIGKKSLFEPSDSEEQQDESNFADKMFKNILKDPEISKPISNIKKRENSAKISREEKSASTIHAVSEYIAPSLDLLTTKSMDVSEFNEDIMYKKEQLELALDTFGIPAKVSEVIVGPSVTRYELEMPPGISVKKVLTHSDDIALNLASNGDIRIEAPIPGKSAVGIEVPNDKIATVGMKEILSSPTFINAKSPLTFAMGKDISGNVMVCNLQKMPHLLIAGATNSGKSVCLNSIIISLIYRTSPEDVRLILIDPKRVEFTMYNGLPHLLLPNVITESDKALNALNWAVNEMERRYALFQTTKTRNYDEYKVCNEVLEGKTEKIPFIVIIIDELADLLMTSKKEVEEKIMRLAQKARAAGIHLILATQRPSVDVVTGTIKANFPSRITFALTSFADSKTILDQGGAEKLLGKGDMLYRPSDAAEPKRIQGCFVTGKEVDDIVEFVKQNNNDFDFDNAVQDSIINPAKNSANGEESSGVITGFDPLMPQALKLVIENGQASISMIQRRFVVGYPRAARIIDQMQEAKYISPSDGSKPRAVYITMEQYEELFGEDK